MWPKLSFQFAGKRFTVPLNFECADFIGRVQAIYSNMPLRAQLTCDSGFEQSLVFYVIRFLVFCAPCVAGAAKASGQLDNLLASVNSFLEGSHSLSPSFALFMPFGF